MFRSSDKARHQTSGRLMTSPVIDKYLARYAEADRELAWAVPGRYDLAVVVPLLGEGHLADPLYPSLSRAAAEAGKGLLAIVLVNATDDHPPWVHVANEMTLNGLTLGACRLRYQRPAWLRPYDEHLTLLILDRAREGFRLPPRSGVGDARKLGCDLALALYAAGVVRDPILSTTDADARVAPDYFAWPHSIAAAICHPFRHRVENNESSALLRYEISLRYYVLGLRHAGSPYAFHTIGSTISVRADAYAAVRGFPKREAAEDFYLLDKLAKVGGVVTGGGAVELVARPSARVPFGTGRSVQKIEEADARGEGYCLYHPHVFEALRAWLGAARDFAEHGDCDRARAAVGDERWLGVLDEQRVWDMLVTAYRTRRQPADRWRHIATAYDSLRTLQLIHRLRDRAYPKLPWREALAAAPFLELPTGDVPELALLESLRRADEAHRLGCWFSQLTPSLRSRRTTATRPSM